MSSKNTSQKNYPNFYTKGLELSERAVEEGTKTTRQQISYIKFSENKKVLDLACGISLFGRTFSNKVYGIDSSREAVKIARKNGINAKLGDVEKKLVFADNSFDIVIASHIIEHLVDPDHMILEAKRILKKGGILIVVTPNLASWINRAVLLLGMQPFFTEVSTQDKTIGLKLTRKITKTRETVGHLRVFTFGAVKDILIHHGFKIDNTAGVEFVGFPFFIKFFDRFFINNPALSSIVVVVGRK